VALRDISFSSESGNITGITYDDETQELTVNFAHGGKYLYHDVPEETAVGFESAPSAGGYLHSFIKGLFGYERI
jgi:lysyl-tRNA synthetase, class II